MIAWGGILAQLLLLSLSLGLFAILNSAGINARGISFIYNKLVVFNLILIGLNLIPIQPLDGARAWKIIRLFPDWYGNHKPKKGLNRKKYLRELIEILNSHAEKPVKPKKIIDLPEYKKRKDRENQE